MSKKILITTAIDYVNDVIHIGHAYQKIVADALARYYRADPENEVFFLTGTDEHGSKAEEAAEKKRVTPKKFVDDISTQDREQLDALGITYDRFIRTTDPDHAAVVVDFYRRSYRNGDIYKGEYRGIYCVGCEEFKKEKDLIDGRCPQHPQSEVKTVTEQNYFFRWSKYADFLRDWIDEHPEFVRHEARRAEMESFLDQGLEDIPISRPNVKFGIPVPDDPEHVLYVWFDALINYVTGAPEYWQDQDATIIHLLGKDNVRWHALLWPAMLKSAGYRLPTTVYGHDFFTLNGQKISKSLGNIIRPTELVEKFGIDGVRYYFLRYGPIRDDVDVTIEGIREVYNADLANGLGNLTARIASMVARANSKFEIRSSKQTQNSNFQNLKQEDQILDEHIKSFRIDLVLEAIWKKIHELDRYVDHNRVWEQTGEGQAESLQYLVENIYAIGLQLAPFLPVTADKIRDQFGQSLINTQSSLFPRLTG